MNIIAEMSQFAQQTADFKAYSTPSTNNYYKQEERKPNEADSVMGHSLRFDIKNGETFIDFGSVDMLAAVLFEMWE